MNADCASKHTSNATTRSPAVAEIADRTAFVHRVESGTCDIVISHM